MKTSSTILWRSAILILWLLSLWAIISEIFRTHYVFTQLSNETYYYSLIGVAIAILITSVQSVLLDFLFRPHRFVEAYLQDGLAILVLVTLSSFALYLLFFITDLLNYVYIPGQFTILLMLLLLLRFIILAIVSIMRLFSKNTQNI